MFSRPALGFAEIAWRWSFGFAAILSLSFLILEYFRTLPVGRGDLFLLRTKHPLLIAQALAHIFGGSAPRMVKATLLLLTMLSGAWIVLASLARKGTVTALLTYLPEDGDVPGGPAEIAPSAKSRRRAPFGLNLLRVVVSAAALLGLAGTFVLAKAASPRTDPSPATAMLIFLMLVTGISLAWWLLNWMLSLAAIFVVADGSGTFSAISQTVDLWRVRWGSIMAAGTWFGMAHTIMFFIATSIVAFPLAFAGILPPGIVLGGVLLVGLLYFAAADFLYAGKMAAYVAIAKLPDDLLFASRISDPIVPPMSGIDRSELILCDIPVIG